MTQPLTSTPEIDTAGVDAAGIGTGEAAAPKVYFDAVLRPHRSLPPVGFLIIMAALTFVSFTAGSAFILMGAWPVFGYFGLDVLLVYIAFRLNYRSGRMYETVQLVGGRLVVEKISVRGERRRWEFQAYWVRVLLEEIDEYSNRLLLRSHGRVLPIAAVLSPGERRDFAAALTRALQRQRDED
jgi:uncharacterized membrane protein